MSAPDSNHDTLPDVDDGRMSTRLRDLLTDPRLRLVLILAALVRLLTGIDLWFSDPLSRVPLSDPAYYFAWASAMANGEGFRESAPYWLPPLYPWVLSIVFRIAGPAIGAVIILQYLLGLFSAALLCLLSYRVAGRRAAIAAEVLWTLYAPVAFFESRLLAVNLAIPLSLIALNLLVRYEHRLATRSESKPSSAESSGAGLALPALAGVVLGAASMARPNLLLAAPVIAVTWLLFRRTVKPQALGICALLIGLLVGIAPSIAINYSRSGALIPITANGGINFWFGNNPAAHGTFHAPSAEWGSIGTQRDVSIAIATEELGRSEPVSESEASAWWFARGRKFLFDSPADALRLWGLKLADTLSSTEFGIQYFPAAIRRISPTLWIGALPFGLLLALGVLGLHDPKRTQTRGRAVLIGWLAAGLIASLLYFTYSRFRLPILVAWMPFAGRGAVVLLDSLRQRVALPVARVGAALALLVISYIPFEGDYPRQLEANTLLDAGMALRVLEDDDRAYQLINRSLRLVEQNPRALVELAQIIEEDGEEQEAFLAYQAARDMPGFYPPAILNSCRMMLGASSESIRDPGRAVRELRAAIDASSPPDLELLLLLSTALIDYPSLARDPGEARWLILQILERDPAHASALQVLRYLDENE